MKILQHFPILGNEKETERRHCSTTIQSDVYLWITLFLNEELEIIWTYNAAYGHFLSTRSTGNNHTV